MGTLGDRLKALRIERGYTTGKSAALAMNVPIATYLRHEAADRHIPARRAAEYARYFGTTPEYILYGRDDNAPTSLPLIDPNGAPCAYRVAAPPSPSAVTCAQQPSPGDGITAFGFIALYDHPEGRTSPLEMVGRLCVVATIRNSQEQRLIRILHRGSSAGRFHLIGSGPDTTLLDALILWAAPVKALIPANRAD
jgi:transcriptional regulator with XRE-family HTH domain